MVTVRKGQVYLSRDDSPEGMEETPAGHLENDGLVFGVRRDYTVSPDTLRAIADTVEAASAPGDRPLSAQVAAAHAGVHPNTIQNWARTGRLRYETGANGRRLFLLRDVEEFMAQLPPHENRGRPKPRREQP